MQRLLSQLRQYEADVDRQVADDFFDWLDRRRDTSLIREKMKQHFAVGIKREQSDNTLDLDGSGSSGYQSYIRGQAAAAIDAGLYEAVNSGVGPKIAQARASLFASPSQNWDYSADSVGDLIAEHRSLGGFKIAASNADFIACACDSAVLHLSWVDGHIKYQTIAPHLVRILFPATVIDEGEPRGPDISEIEDSAVVIIDAGTVDTGGSQLHAYRAYWGESDAYPKGRCLDYAAETWANIPSVGDSAGGILAEYLDGGEPANPLTLARQKYGDGPEYPVTIIRGGVIRTKRDLLPFTTSLYEASLEIELAWSRILKDGLDAMHASFFVSNPAGVPLPKPGGSYTALNEGQTVEMLGKSTSDARLGAELLRDLISVTASGYDVPDYQVISIPAGLEPSGIALAIKTQPLIEHRERRVEINRSAIARLFAVERGLINVHSSSEIGINVEQTWEPGQPVLAQDRTARLQLIRDQLDAGLVSYAEAYRLWHNLPSIDAAQDGIAALKEQNEQAAPPSAAPQLPQRPTGGLPRPTFKK